MTSFKQEVAELLAQWAPYDTIKKVFEDTEAVLHPPVRTAFIGTGPSGTKNHADWRGILEAMNSSSINIILYIYDQQIKAEVAKVVKLFPTLREVRSLQDIEEQYGVAA
jgi:hypothetical protein